ncbi:MAG: 2-hydroxyacyl-CoA dehydratase family protein, partial [Dehalococcoidia bacterium]|nr:2-hydroxyacyl-CoA dehydratase family protein [Dehalococcoidia bacterium]
MTTVNMEQKLARLLQAAAEPNNTKWAREWKKRGGKVIGILCSYVPEEVIHAGGAFPFHITGTQHGQLKESSRYWPSNAEQYYAHALESLLSGELEFLDGVVCTDSTDASRRCLDVWQHIGKTPYCYMLHVPYRRPAIAEREFAEEIRRFRDSIQSRLSVRVTNDTLLSSIRLHNRMRVEMAKVYELRKRDMPPLSGAEFLGLTTAALVMPKETFLEYLEGVSDYLTRRKTSLTKVKPRLMVSSDRLFHPGYLEAIEAQGALVAMDDLDTGSRF